MVAWRAWWKDILMIIQSIDEQYQDKDQNTHKLEQSVTILGAWLFLPRGSWSAASCHKVLDDAFDSLHTACSEQQGIHLVVWQLEHYAAPRFFDCPQSYTRHETLRKTDWQLPIKFQSEIGQMSPTTRHRQAAAKEGYLGIFKAPLHGICELLYIVYKQQWIIKKLLS